MKIRATKIIDLNNGLLKNSYNKINPVVFTVISVIGITAGVCIQSLNATLNQDFFGKFNEFLSVNATKTFAELFAGNIIYNLIFLLFPFFLGMSAFGFAFIYLIPLIKGLGIGSACGLIYSSYGLTGIGYCLLIIFPVALIQFITIILSCSESCQMSSDIFSALRKENIAEEIRMKMFFLRYAIIAVITLISSIVYAVCNLLFFKIIT